MRSCFLAKLSLWPRFHSAVKESLKGRHDSDVDSVVEIHLKLTEEMREIQSNIMDLASSMLSELKRLVPAISDEEVTVETALTKGFEKIIQAYVDPVWNTIDVKSKEILTDLKVFRLLLSHLTKSDCITFYSILCEYTSQEAALRSKSGWILSKSAEKIINAARKRLKPPTHSGKKSEDDSDFDPEVHPKWLAIGEVLQEINTKMEEEENDETEEEAEGCCLAKCKTLIFAEDFKTCSTIRDYLSKGKKLTLAKIARNCDNVKLAIPPEIILQLNSITRNEKVDPAIAVAGGGETIVTKVLEAMMK